MTHEYKECKHCLSDYSYQGSGFGCFDEDNDDTYCPECKKAINEALKQIPRKFEYKFVPTDDVNLETLLHWEQEHKREVEERGGFHSKRVLAGLMNLKTGERDVYHEVIGREDKKGRIYIYHYWSSDENDKSKWHITAERKVEIATGKPGRYKVK